MAAHRFSSVIVLGIAITGAIYFPGQCLAQENEPNVDAMGCPNLTIFPKLALSVVVSCQRADSVEVSIPLKPDDRGYGREKIVRGAYEFREYQLPQMETQEQAYNSLVQLAAMGGFAVKYSDGASTITARKGDFWALLRISGEYYDLKVVRVTEEPWAPVQNAQEISREIDAHNRAAIYGIAFSSDNQAVIEEKSTILIEVLKYLRGNPALAINVESHKVSNPGTAEEDQEITRKRAQAVVDWLVSHGIAAGRLRAMALGRNKPVTDNDTPQEIQRNERIELARAIS